MRVFLPTRRARTALVAVAVLTFSASAFGQNGHSLVAAAQVAANQASAQPDQSGPTRRLSMDDAVKLALEQNLGIRIQRIDPQIQDLGIGQAKALWTPTLTSSLSRNSVSTPASSIIVPTNQTGTFGTGIGMNQTLPWGG